MALACFWSGVQLHPSCSPVARVARVNHRVTCSAKPSTSTPTPGPLILRADRKGAPPAGVVSTGKSTARPRRLRNRSSGDTSLALSTLTEERLDELHEHLRTASSWKDVFATFETLEEDELLDVDDGAIATSLYRLGSFYINSTRAQQAQLDRTGLVKKLAKLSEMHIQELEAEHVWQILHAFADLRYKPAPALLRALADQTAARLYDFHPHQLVTVLAAFVTLGYQPKKELVADMVSVITDHSPDLTPHDVSTTLAALATLKHKPGKAAAQGLKTYFKHQLDGFRPSEIAESLRAMAALNLAPGEDVLQRIAMRAGRQLPTAMVRSSNTQQGRMA